MRVLIASAGTGGHIFPAIAVAEEIRSRKPDTQLLFMGARNKSLEGPRFRDGLRFAPVPTVGMPRKPSLDWAPFAFRLLVSFDQSLRRIASFRPHVAIGFGNCSTLAPLLAAKACGTPVAIHEANVIPGKANLLLSRLSDKVLVSFPRTARHFRGHVRDIPPCRGAGGAEVVGMPLRKEFTQRRNRLGALADIKLSGTEFTLLVAGGSQGARALNREVCNSLPRLQQMSPKIQIIHLTGKSDYPWVTACYARSSLRSHVAAFEPRMKRLYDAADLVVSRAGASTIAEIVRTGKPAILVPFPYATQQHQAENARLLEENNGAIVLTQRSSSSGESPLVPGLLEKVMELARDSHRLREMADSNRRLSNGSAARNIVDVLFKIARPQEAVARNRINRPVPVPA